MVEFSPGVEIDGFLLGERLHAGGMALLFEVTKPGMDFPLLMKVPRLGHGESAGTIIGFEVEQMLLAALTGPYVPRFVACGDITEKPYIVMEHIDGRVLSEWADSAPHPAEEVARLGAALAAAAHSLHQQDAVHLDLKPRNALIRPSGEAVLIDFGLAHHGHFPDLLAEEFSAPLGSPPYMAPEQIFHVRCDPRSDIFAIGAMLYELATGRLPYGAPSTIAGLRKRLWNDPTPPRALVPALPEWLQEVILRCLEVDASKRYGSAAQLAFDLSHPDQVVITERGRRLHAAGMTTRFRSWFRAAGYEPAPCPQPSSRINSAPIVLVAVATTHTNEAQFESLRQAVRRAATLDAACRVAVATVIKPEPIVGSATQDGTSTSQHIKHLVHLRHWAKKLQLPPERLTFHVLESSDPADALLKYARSNHVDQIVIGAPPPGLPLRSLFGTVATCVMVEAPCSVTVVRTREGTAPRSEGTV